MSMMLMPDEQGLPYDYVEPVPKQDEDRRWYQRITDAIRDFFRWIRGWF